jgi:single-stranded DNA-binding protein
MTNRPSHRERYATQALRLWLRVEQPLSSRQLADLLGCSIWTALAVNDQNQPMFIDVATLSAQADACTKYLSKGRAVAVTGRLGYREWDDSGTRRSRHHIIGRVQFGGRPNGDQPTETANDQEDAA